MSCSSTSVNDVCSLCRPGFYLLASQCIACPGNCSYCQNSSGNLTCQKCADGYYLNTNGTCVSCFQNCEVCSG